MKRIALIGPESTGKSTLTMALAEYFKATAVDEYARTYIEQIGYQYDYQDVVHIAEQQIKELETHYPTPLVFFDTDLIITKVWFEVKYGACPQFVTDYLTQHPIDYYLLCAPDIAFVPDPVRENPDLREELFERYLAEIQTLGVPYGIVKREGEQRIMHAIHLVKEYLV